MGHKVLDMTEGLTLIYLNMYDGLEARNNLGTSLVVQWLGLYASTAGGKDSIPGRETKTLKAVVFCQKIKFFKMKEKKNPEKDVTQFSLNICNPPSPPLTSGKLP